MNDLQKSIEFTEYVLQEKVKIARKKLNMLTTKFGKYMNISWILNMFIINQQTQKFAPGRTTSGFLGLRKKKEKVGIIAKLKQKNFSERKQTLKKKLSQKEPMEPKKKKDSKINQPRPIICPLLNFKDKENIFKNSRKLKRTKKFVNKDFCQETLEHRRELSKEVKCLRERKIRLLI